MKRLANILSICAIVLAVAVLGVALSSIPTVASKSMQTVYGVDFIRFFRPALLADDPYSVTGYFNPFWTLLFVWIIGIFGKWQVTAWVMVNLLAYLFVLQRFNLRAMTIPFLFFSGAFLGIYVGNVEGLVALGLVAPAPVGVILLMMKPQIGMAVVAYYVLSASVYEGWKRAALIVAPVMILLIASVAVYGDWYMNSSLVAAADWNSISIFPWGVPFGALLIAFGVYRKNVGYALMAIPLTAPYLIHHSWAFPILGVVLAVQKDVKFIHRKPSRTFPQTFVLGVTATRYAVVIALGFHDVVIELPQIRRIQWRIK